MEKKQDDFQAIFDDVQKQTGLSREEICKFPLGAVVGHSTTAQGNTPDHAADGLIKVSALAMAGAISTVCVDKVPEAQAILSPAENSQPQASNHTSPTESTTIATRVTVQNPPASSSKAQTIAKYLCEKVPFLMHPVACEATHDALKPNAPAKSDGLPSHSK